jgi:hypothetical protein
VWPSSNGDAFRSGVLPPKCKARMPTPGSCWSTDNRKMGSSLQSQKFSR